MNPGHWSWSVACHEAFPPTPEKILIPIDCVRVGKRNEMTYLESQSTTTKITDFPIEVGTPSIKSREMSSQTCYRMRKGSSKPSGFNISYLLY